MLLIFFIFLPFTICAQKKVAVDSIYYLLDTSKTLLNERMWNIGHTDLYQQYTLLCPCLKFAGNPVFTHEIRDKGIIITNSVLKSLKLISITDLISVSKKFLDDGNLLGRYLFFMIEPKGNRYIVHEVTLTNPAIKIVSAPDVMQAKPDTSAFIDKRLPIVTADEFKNHLNEVIITGGRVVDTKIDTNGSVLLYVNNGNTSSEFKVLIKKADVNNFDLPERHYLSKTIKVTGKIIKYKGEPVVNVNNENQFLMITK